MSDDARTPGPSGPPPPPPLPASAGAPSPGASAPAAIRVTRPYATEELFLEQEGEMLTRTSVTLVGAQPRAPGAMLRFELVLASGQPLLRGEGRVVMFKQNAHRGTPGLTLRFTRLDSRSKALVDRVAALREPRRSPSLAPPPVAPGAAPSSLASLPAPPSPPALALPPAAPPSAPSLEEAATQAPAAVLPPVAPSVPPPAPPASPPAPTVPPPRPPSPLPPRPDSVYDAPTAVARRVLPPAPLDREALLDRLRARAKTLAPGEVERILERRRAGQ